MFYIRGFSLFAPLVGTSVMIIAVIVASVLVNNDIRTSRGITASYSRGELAGIAESIRAFVFATTADTVADTVKDTLKDGVGIKCGSAAECDSKMSAELLDRVYNSVKDNMMPAYGNAINAFASKLPGVDVSNLNQVISAMSLQLFKGFEGDEEGNSYVTVGREGMAPEDYSLVLKRGDITESVPMLPPQPLRVKLPWKIHGLSKELSEESGTVFAAAGSGGLDVTQTCSWSQQTCCGEDSCWCCGCDSEGYSLSGSLATSWDVSGIASDSGSGCPSISGILDDAKAAAIIKAYLLQTASPPDFTVDSLAVQVSGTTAQNAPSSSCGCPNTYGYFRMSPANIKADWSVRSVNKPDLTIPISYRNYD